MMIAEGEMAVLLTGTILAIAVILVIAFVVRQARRARRLQAEIDYSRVRRWEDEEDGDETK